MGYIRSLISLETLRDAVPAAAAAMAVLAVTLYVAESYQIPYLPSQAIDATSSVLSPSGLSQLMSLVGELGKAFTFAGILALQFLIFVAAWLLTLRWRQPGDARMTVRRALACSAIIATVFLVIAGFFALAADTASIRGWEWAEFAGLTGVGVVLFSGLAELINRALVWRRGARGTPQPDATDLTRVLSRRRLLAGGAAWALVIAAGAPAWYLGKSVAATARTGVVRALDGIWSLEVTPTPDFYVVSKNLDGFDPDVDVQSWRLRVDGLVSEERMLRLEDLQTLPMTRDYNTLMCISYRIGGRLISNASWTGAALRDVLDLAGPRPEATHLRFTSADDYTESLPLAVAMDPDVRLVWLMNDEPLTRKHGYPLRAIVPGRYGMKNPKWITDLTLLDQDHSGYWVERGWSSTAFIQTMSRFDVPARMAEVQAGPAGLRGIAFGGDRGIQAVEVSLDGGETWRAARVHPPLSRYSWVRWEYDYTASPGQHRFVVRAIDGDGVPQIMERRDPLPEGATGYHVRPIRVNRST